MNFRDRILQERDGLDSIYESANDNDSNQVYQSDYYRVESLRNKPACISFKLSDETEVSFPYSMVQKIKHDPEDGIIITSSNMKIIIKGRVLRRLFQYISSYRVSYVFENVGTDLKEDGLHVEKIIIEDI